MSALIKGIEISKKHSEVAREKEKLSGIILKLLKEYQNDNQVISISTCRNLQDVIYSLRSGCPIIPDWWYRRFQDEFKTSTNEALNQLTTKTEEK